MSDPDLRDTEVLNADENYLTLFIRKPERMQYFQWLASEQQRYADPKFSNQRPAHDEEMRKDGIADDSWWYNQFAQYIQRARVLGLENPNGRQALVKCSAALIGCIESMIRVYGDLPEPGYSSGEIHPWNWKEDL